MSDRDTGSSKRRQANGQFQKGASGNPHGARLRRPKELLTYTDCQRLILEVSCEVVGTINGKPVTRYQNAVRNSFGGRSANRLASKDSIELTKAAAMHLDRVRREEEESRERERRGLRPGTGY